MTHPLALALIVAFTALDSRADEHAPGHESHDPHHHGLFIDNLVVGETPSPHSELRLKYIFEHNNGAEAHTLEAGFEFALARWISFELELPYVVLSDDGHHPSHTDSLGIALKLASFALEEHGILIGGGIELELPTGDDDKGIGSDHILVIEPFLTAAIQRGPFDFVAKLALAMPCNESAEERDDVDLALAWQFAVVWHMHDRIALLVELDGECIVAGDEDEHLMNISPGIKLRPFDSDIEFGAAVTFPLLDDPGYDVKFTLAVFLHF